MLFHAFISLYDYDITLDVHREIQNNNKILEERSYFALHKKVLFNFVNTRGMKSKVYIYVIKLLD